MSQKSYEQNCRNGYSSPSHETSWTAAIEQRVHGTLSGSTHELCNTLGMRLKTMQRWGTPVIDTTEEWAELTAAIAEDLRIDPAQILFERANNPKLARRMLQFCLGRNLPVFVEVPTRNPSGHSQTYGLEPIHGSKFINVTSNYIGLGLANNITIDYIAERMDYPSKFAQFTDSFNDANITILPKGV